MVNIWLIYGSHDLDDDWGTPRNPTIQETAPSLRGDEGRTAPRWSSGRLLLVCSSMIYSLSIYLINLYLDDSVLNAMFEGLIYM